MTSKQEVRVFKCNGIRGCDVTCEEDSVLVRKQDYDAVVAERDRLRDELNEAHQWVASLMTHMEDHWRGIDEGPIERARAYLKPAMAAARASDVDLYHHAESSSDPPT